MPKRIGKRSGRVFWPLLLAGACLHCSKPERRGAARSNGATAAPTASVPVEDAIRGDFEPEQGTFGVSGPDPYEARLHELLFEQDRYRICQLVTMPSFEAESAVYIATREPGPPLVVHRALNEQLWGLMMTEITIQAGDPRLRKSIGIGPASQMAALARIHASNATVRAELDQTTVNVLSRACEAVLMRARYSGASSGLDGTIYHAGSWKPGTFLAAQAWSPKVGTIANDYLALAESLRAYAASTPSRRDGIKAELVAKAERLIARTDNKR